MSSGSAKCYGTKSKKSKKGGGLTPARSYSGLGDVASGAASETGIPSSLPSTSTMALSLQSASAGSFPKVGLTLLKTSSLLSDSKGMDQEEVQREHCGEKPHSIQVRNQSRMAASAAVTSEVEPIELDRHVDEEIVDLTSESSIVDLTHNDSLVCIEESRQWQNQELRSRPLSDSCILCSDEDNSEYSVCDIIAATKLPKELAKERFGSSGASGIVSCPICMDGYAEIISGGRLIVSTKCGHIFCNQCLHNSLRSASSCPTCRKKLNHKQYHPIYI
ncbi:large ribosomal subunit protein bL21m isoform X1 [Elgaria multicarinata webbii]|uniref:large ribosomal subunit protein bL21m isoform X1 n=1 Tax=Elgaria multicarinata webbii TaxID=159646 RepID=UPI002FCD30F8